MDTEFSVGCGEAAWQGNDTLEDTADARQKDQGIHASLRKKAARQGKQDRFKGASERLDLMARKPRL